MKSIQSKLAIGLLVSLTLIFTTMWFIVSNNIQQSSEEYISARLEHDVETLLTAISFNDSNIIINETVINPIYKRAFSGHYYIIQYRNDIFRSRSLWDQSLALTNVTDNTYTKSIQTGPDNQPLIIISRPFTKQNKTITIHIAEDLTPTIKQINKLKSNFTLLSAFILIIFLFLQFTILRIGLKPLRNVQKEMQDLKKGDIGKLSTKVPSELKSIITEINQLSLFLHKRLKRSRNALSDLSHAIKKPLTLLQHFSDENKDSFSESTRLFLQEQIYSIQQTTDRILKRARIAGVQKSNAPFNLNDDFSLLIKAISAMYPNKKITINAEIETQAITEIEREDLLELLGNFLDNAYKWASTTINVIIKKEHGLYIVIEDDGQGENIESLSELTDRGVRLDESVEGYGFGLAISDDIVQDYNGTLLFERSEQLGGFKAKINLPSHT